MPEIDVFDGHCDAVLRCCLTGEHLDRNGGHVDLERGRRYRRYAQFFALFAQPEDFPDRSFRSMFELQYGLFSREREANASVIAHCRGLEEAETAFAAGKMAAFLSVEGAELLDCSLERLEAAHKLGVRAVNLTWNRPNALGGTNAENTDKGLTGQGKDFVRKAEKLGVLVDVSHLSDPGFWDVAETLSGPFFASHSNSRAVHSHPRNLTDEQFTAIIDHGGVAGLNLFAEFVGGKADLDAVAAHLDHWLELGGEKNIALGGDLDGCSPLAGGMAGLQDYETLYHFLRSRGYSQALVQDLFFNNLMRVVSEVCTM